MPSAILWLAGGFQCFVHLLFFIFVIQGALYWVYKLIISADVKVLAKGKSFHYKQKSKSQKEHLKVHNSRNHIPTNRTELNTDGILLSVL